MQTILFHDTIFGPIHSRRLGVSLGVNLMPRDGKICSFDCLYCEAGFNAQGPGKSGLPSRAEVCRLLRDKLEQMQRDGQKPDVITFSGNGEPTLHPEFAGIIDDVLELRDTYFPAAKVSVLSNSTQLHRPDVVEALRRVDNNILKLDSAVESTMRTLDRPASPAFTVDSVVEQLAAFADNCIIQTMFTAGEYDGKSFDNTTDAEVAALIDAYRRIKPAEVMVYSIDRRTPAQNLRKMDADTLRAIAGRITAETGIPVQLTV